MCERKPPPDSTSNGSDDESVASAGAREILNSERKKKFRPARGTELSLHNESQAHIQNSFRSLILSTEINTVRGPYLSYQPGYRSIDSRNS